MKIANALKTAFKGLRIAYAEYKLDMTVKGNVDKEVFFHFGTQLEFSRWVANRGQKEKYPLIWYVKDTYEEPDECGYIEGNAKIILFTSTKKDYYNDQRILVNYNEILHPLAKKVIDIIKYNQFIQPMNKSFQVDDIECYAGERQDFNTNKTQNVALDYLDAKVIQNKLRVYENKCN